VAEGLLEGTDGKRRCWWPGADASYLRYHDDEWGCPVADDHRLFEKICLEGFQAGLSWLTVLRKRPRFREVFFDFDFERVAEMQDEDVERLLGDPGIIRHRAKIASTIHNARRARELAEEAGSLAAFFWSFEPAPEERPARFDASALSQLSKTPTSARLSKALKDRGWTFVGPTTAYAFMQAMGLVNDHLEGCFARPGVEAARRRFRRPS
jgi:DNA-3-methyladenine glycosylase I